MSDPQLDFKTRWQTVWILVLVAAGLIAWDVYAAFGTPGAGDTISEVLLSWARAHPVLPFLGGVLGGHLFWPQQVREPK